MLALLASTVLAVNFDFETRKLTEAETDQFPAIRFRDASQVPP